MNNDVIGKALLDYYNKDYTADIIVKSSITEDDIISVPYLFRTKKQLPKLEQKALELCIGRVLDVGAGSGCHSFILQENNIAVTAIDISAGAVEVMKKRKLNVENVNFYDVTQQYDTLLFLMNGVGIAKTLKSLNIFLSKAKSLLNKGGQVLLDSSDISYIFKEDDGSMWVDLNSSYYGEVTYQMQYKNLITEKFDWLFVDFLTLKNVATNLGFRVELVVEDENNQYLARLCL